MTTSLGRSLVATARDHARQYTSFWMLIAFLVGVSLVSLALRVVLGR